MTVSRDAVLAAPIRRLLKDEVRSLSIQCDDPIPQMSFRSGVSEKLIRRILHGQKHVEFNTADAIITRIFGPMLWHEDGELKALYEGADLSNPSRKTRAPAPGHGRRSRYNKGCRCAPCVLANSEYHRQRRAACAS